MGFRTGAIATVWSVEQARGNFKNVRLSVSRKDKTTGEYVQDFSGFCTFIGEANANAGSLKARDRIRLGDVDVSTNYDKSANKEYVNYKVFTFEKADESGSGAPAAPAAPAANPAEGDTGEMPF